MFCLISPISAEDSATCLISLLLLILQRLTHVRLCRLQARDSSQIQIPMLLLSMPFSTLATQLALDVTGSWRSVTWRIIDVFATWHAVVNSKGIQAVAFRQTRCSSLMYKNLTWRRGKTVNAVTEMTPLRPYCNNIGKASIFQNTKLSRLAASFLWREQS